MKIKLVICALLLLPFLSDAKDAAPGKPVADPKSILKDDGTLYRYITNDVRLCENFTPYNQASKVISKEAFFKQISTGTYLPVKLVSNGSLAAYQLYKVGEETNSVRYARLLAMGKQYYINFKRVGKPLAAFNIVDLNGKRYTPQNTKGKYIVFKCWFIGCHACVEEMPRVNQLAAGYKNRKDVLFVSLAFDAAKELNVFLKKHQFDFAVVPKQGKYMTETLGVDTFPTSILVGKDGLVIAGGQSEELFEVLKKLP